VTCVTKKQIQKPKLNYTRAHCNTNVAPIAISGKLLLGLMKKIL
jgi:hypothetical protein